MTDKKELIANVAYELIFIENKKRLTVTDIVDKCHITRQTFYYYFEDIPSLLKWLLSKAKQILTDNRKKLDELAKFLYEKETITNDEFMEILNKE